MKRVIIIVLLLGSLVACKKDNEPSPQAVDFQLTEARFNNEIMTPMPSYTLTLHWDATGVPTVYETTGSHARAPALGQQGTWEQNGAQITFTSVDGSESRTVTVSGAKIDVLSTQIEMSWSLGKTEIAWEQAGSYMYSFERVE